MRLMVIKATLILLVVLITTRCTDGSGGDDNTREWQEYQFPIGTTTTTTTTTAASTGNLQDQHSGRHCDLQQISLQQLLTYIHLARGDDHPETENQKQSNQDEKQEHNTEYYKRKLKELFSKPFLLRQIYSPSPIVSELSSTTSTTTTATNIISEHCKQLLHELESSDNDYYTVKDNQLLRCLTARNQLLKGGIAESEILLSSANSFSYDKKPSTLASYIRNHVVPWNLTMKANSSFYHFGDTPYELVEPVAITEEGKVWKTSYLIEMIKEGVPSWDHLFSFYVEPNFKFSKLFFEGTGTIIEKADSDRNSGKSNSVSSSSSSSKSSVSSSGGGGGSRGVALAYGMGGRGSGVTWHRHGGVWASAVQSSKRWFLSPPSLPPPSFHPNHTSIAWLHSYLSLHFTSTTTTSTATSSSTDFTNELYVEELVTMPIDDANILDCICSPGEAIFLPDDWWHATLNLGEAVFMSAFL